MIMFLEFISTFTLGIFVPNIASSKCRTFFPKSRGIFGSLVANLNIEKFLKFIELILVRVFLDGNLMVIGRYRVSQGSK